jgi:hypothetical protein
MYCNDSVESERLKKNKKRKKREEIKKKRVRG